MLLVKKYHFDTIKKYHFDTIKKYHFDTIKKCRNCTIGNKQSQLVKQILQLYYVNKC